MLKQINPLPLIKQFSKSVCRNGKENFGRELLLLIVGCITSFRLVLVHFESLRILVQLKDLNMFFTPWRVLQRNKTTLFLVH